MGVPQHVTYGVELWDLLSLLLHGRPAADLDRNKVTGPEWLVPRGAWRTPWTQPLARQASKLESAFKALDCIRPCHDIQVFTKLFVFMFKFATVSHIHA